ncbi:MAG TPA: Hpt domain-containing protein, partial [Bacillota bacterium]|nr:Hpt domain-containing protein [Bacillota bacterium]
DLFLDCVPQSLNQIHQSLHDPLQVAFHAHSLKSMSLNLGAKRIIQLSQKLEDLGRAGALETAPALLQELQTAFQQTKAKLLLIRNT